MTRSFSALAIFVAIASAAWAEVESGPKEGAKIAELKAHGVVGTGEGKEIDFAAERKDDVTVYCFVNAAKFDRPMNQFFKKLDAALPGVEKSAAIAVWVGGEKDKLTEYLPKVQKSVKYEQISLAVFDGDVSKLKDWNINESAHLTVVVAAKGKVIKTFAFETVNGTDAKGVEEVLKKIGK